MGKGAGIAIMILAALSIYYRGQVIGYTGGGGPDYALWVGVILFIIGAITFAFSKPKPPRLLG